MKCGKFLSFACLQIIVSFCGSCSVSRTNTSLYRPLPLGSPVQSLSLGGKGLWATGVDGQVYFRPDITTVTKENWTFVDTGYTIASGLESVWGIDKDGQLHFRTGFDPTHPYGRAWLGIPLPPAVKVRFLSVNGVTDVPLLLARDGRVFLRNLNIGGPLQGVSWTEITEQPCTDVSQGVNWAFCLTAKGEILYRPVRFRGDTRPGEHKWNSLPDNTQPLVKMQLITADREGLWGLDGDGKLFRKTIDWERTDGGELSSWEPRHPDIRFKEISVFLPTGSLAVITAKCFGPWLRQKRPVPQIFPMQKFLARNRVTCNNLCSNHPSCSYFIYRPGSWGNRRRTCWVYRQNIRPSDLTWGPQVWSRNAMECPA